MARVGARAWRELAQVHMARVRVRMHDRTRARLSKRTTPLEMKGIRAQLGTFDSFPYPRERPLLSNRREKCRKLRSSYIFISFFSPYILS